MSLRQEHPLLVTFLVLILSYASLHFSPYTVKMKSCENRHS